MTELVGFPGGEESAKPREPGPREPGPIEVAVKADLAALAERVRPGKLALAAMALKLARVLDTRGDEEPASQTAKAVDTLRITMNQLTAGEDHDPEEQQRISDFLGTPSAGGSSVSAPIRYPAKPR